jgi:hypothetical protein
MFFHFCSPLAHYYSLLLRDQIVLESVAFDTLALRTESAWEAFVSQDISIPFRATSVVTKKETKISIADKARHYGLTAMTLAQSDPACMAMLVACVQKMTDQHSKNMALKKIFVGDDVMQVTKAAGSQSNHRQKGGSLNMSAPKRKMIREAEVRYCTVECNVLAADCAHDMTMILCDNEHCSRKYFHKGLSFSLIFSHSFSHHFLMSPYFRLSIRRTSTTGCRLLLHC